MVNKLAHDIRIAADRKLAAITSGHTKTAEVFFREPNPDMNSYEQGAQRGEDIIGVGGGMFGAGTGGILGGLSGALMVPDEHIGKGALAGAILGALAGGYLGRGTGRLSKRLVYDTLPDVVSSPPEDGHPTADSRLKGRAISGAMSGLGSGLALGSMAGHTPGNTILTGLIGALSGGAGVPLTGSWLDAIGKESLDMI